MKELVLFYSYGGSTKRLAEARVSGSGADIFEVRDAKRRSKPSAFVSGSFHSLRMKAWPIEPITINLSGYDKITLMAPVWAGYPAPAAIAALNAIPSGKEIEVVMVSMSGQSGAKGKIEMVLSAKGCRLVNYSDVKGK